MRVNYEMKSIMGGVFFGAATLALLLMATAQDLPKDTLQDLPAPPPQPGEEAWAFINDLKAPLWANGLGWSPRAAATGEADLSRGIRVDAAFPDPEGLLKTAYADLADFCVAGKISTNGPFKIETVKAEMPVFEAYRIEVTADRCRILAADTEGIRRGIFCVEDMMRAVGGPFLKLGTEERKPFITSRISRCFFGPIKRPPRYRDELMDEMDYYPDQYLNRLAHEGVNGLWLTITFKDMCKISVAPEHGVTAERRIAKLRQTVEQCRRYGISIYVFSIEPTAWEAESPVLKRHPEMGAKIGNIYPFCPWSETSQRYLYESTHFIFSQVPHLGGMINISHGERRTTCQSCIAATSNARSSCPVCAKKEPWEIIHKTLEPMAKGMHDANPDATFIAWFYMPQDAPLGDWVYELPEHCPKYVTMQFNFESGVTKEVFGRGRRGADYWISTPGPSRRYERLASFAKVAETPMSAKIQTGCSHEVASIPFVPVPGMLYRKFSAMRELGVSQVMLCWYFGNYPGIMNKAACELSFEPFPASEEEFLSRLVRPEWGQHAETVARALTLFTEGYGHYPLVTEFQYWGPMADGVVWPLLLRPRDVPLAPTWQIAWHTGKHIGTPFAPSGDRIGEALGQEYSLSEAIEECRAMSTLWDQGVALLQSVEAADPALLPERRLDIGVARALGIQFRSGLNILRFYDLRERMVNEKPAKQLVTLGEMRRIVEAELKSGPELIGLCERDSRLGFHSEAEGYKYFPEKIRWRMDQLQGVLAKEIPALEREIKGGTDVFAEYSGRVPAGESLRSLYCAEIGNRTKDISDLFPKEFVWQRCEKPAPRKDGSTNFRWTLCHDRDAFYVVFDGAIKTDQITLTLETRRLWTCLNYGMSASGGKNSWLSQNFDAHAREGVDGWQGWLRLPFVSLGMDAVAPASLRFNVRHRSSGGERTWIARNPWPYRLRLCNENPADLGWLFFD